MRSRIMTPISAKMTWWTLMMIGNLQKVMVNKTVMEVTKIGIKIRITATRMMKRRLKVIQIMSWISATAMMK